MEFAGFKISRDSIRPCDKFAEAITNFPKPKDITGVRIWFRLVNQAAYSFSVLDIMLPFCQLLKPKQQFV